MWYEGVIHIENQWWGGATPDMSAYLKRDQTIPQETTDRFYFDKLSLWNETQNYDLDSEWNAWFRSPHSEPVMWTELITNGSFATNLNWRTYWAGWTLWSWYVYPTWVEWYITSMDWESALSQNVVMESGKLYKLVLRWNGAPSYHTATSTIDTLTIWWQNIPLTYPPAQITWITTILFVSTVSWSVPFIYTPSLEWDRWGWKFYDISLKQLTESESALYLRNTDWSVWLELSSWGLYNNVSIGKGSLKRAFWANNFSIGNDNFQTLWTWHDNFFIWNNLDVSDEADSWKLNIANTIFWAWSWQYFNISIWAKQYIWTCRLTLNWWWIWILWNTNSEFVHQQSLDWATKTFSLWYKSSNNTVVLDAVAENGSSQQSWESGKLIIQNTRWNGIEFKTWVHYNQLVSRMFIWYTGKVGIWTTSPTANLHIKAGSAAAGNAPLKIDSWTLLTTPEVWAIEFWVDRYYATINWNIRKQLAFKEDIDSISYEQVQFDLNYDNLSWTSWNNFSNWERQQVILWTTTNENPRGIANATKVTLHNTPTDMYKWFDTVIGQEYTFSIRAKFDTVTSLTLWVLLHYMDWANWKYIKETNANWRQKVSIRFIAESTTTQVFVGWINDVLGWYQQTAGTCYLFGYKCEPSQKFDEMNYLPVFDLLRWIGRDYRASAGWINNWWVITVGYPDVFWVRRASAITFASEAQAQQWHYYNISNRVPTLEAGKNYIYGIRLNKVFAWNIVITLADNNWRFEYPQLVDNNLWWRQYYELEFTYKWNWLFFYFWGSWTIRQTAWTFYMYWLTLRQAPLPILAWVQEVIAGDWIAVDNTDPSTPIVSVIGWGGWATQRFEYWQITLANIETTVWNIWDPLSLPSLNQWFWNKNISINVEKYLRCFVDIIEYNRNTQKEAQRRNKMRFASTEDINTFIIENCTQYYNGDDVLVYENSVIALFYDIIDWSIQWLPKVNGWNTFYQMLRGRHKELNWTFWMKHLQINWEEGQGMSSTLYTNFIQRAFDAMFPERWLTAEEWLYDWPIWSLFWFPANYRKRFNLLKSNAIINKAGGSASVQSYLQYDATVPEYSWKYIAPDWERTVDQSRTKYCLYTYDSTDVSIIDKNNAKWLVDGLKDTYASVVVLYCLTRTDPANAEIQRYSIYVKPVNIDTIYLSPFDDAIYELNAISEWYIKYPTLETPWYSNYQWPPYNCTRVSKNDRYSALWRRQRNIKWIKNNSTRFMLRRRADWMIWPITVQKAVFEWPRRDRPITTKIAYS